MQGQPFKIFEKWQLEKEQAIPLMTYRDWEGDECIFNKTSLKDALTGTSRETIWFQVHLSWADLIENSNKSSVSFRIFTKVTTVSRLATDIPEPV
ncbi:unnamed protein product [Polarella glacialis]|uniref:Uncharacterized protein n=1 Tax=Polarella glacialis TaxID=89957 RepID=A0A813JWH2_POLGL|nr:unnamed protein product [Polarella glacialis]